MSFIHPSFLYETQKKNIILINLCILQVKSVFQPRPYQIELFKHALEKNSILVLGTGSGKTFISILLIKELAHQVSKYLM